MGQGPADPGAVGAGLLTPFWLDRGLRVLAVGGAAGALLMTASRAECEVVVLVPDAAGARAAGASSVGLPGVSVVHATLSEWLRRGDAGRDPFDLVVHVRDTHRPDGEVPSLRHVVAAAAGLLGAEGSLVIAARNPWGLRAILTGTGHPGGPGPAGLRALLVEHAFTIERWLLPFPDQADPRVILDAALLDEPGGGDLAKVLVRRPVSLTDGAAPAVDAWAAFRSAVDAGALSDVADALLVAARRRGAHGPPITRDGRLWTMDPEGRRDGWRSARQLRRMGDRWLLHALRSHQPVASGPFVLEPATISVPAGRSAEDVLTRALIDDGLDAPATRELLACWWTAARAALESSPPERRPLDLQAAHFVVGSDGAWHFLAQELTCRFPVPPEALAFGATVSTLAEAVLPVGWIPGLAPSMTLAEAATEVLRAAGVECGDEHRYLWRELEADLLVRTGPAGAGRDDWRERLASLTEARLETWLDGLPTWRLTAAGREAPGLAAEVRTLRREVEALRAELSAARARIEDEPAPEVPHG